jgi:hypothetical protein
MAPAETMPALPMGSSGWGIAVTGVSLVMSDRRWKRSSDHPRAPITQDDAADEGLEPIAGRATLEQVGRQGFRLLLGATELAGVGNLFPLATACETRMTRRSSADRGSGSVGP